jgi:dephospho-CoA kinase
VHSTYAREDVKATLREWWGDSIFNRDGTVNRGAIGRRVFSNEAERLRLEQLVHPMVYAERDRLMAERADDPATTCFVWDTPLLVETGGHTRCDALVFVDVPEAVRLQRVATRGWDAAVLKKREKLQLALEKKKRLADYVISNATDAASAREQVRRVYSLIINRTV